MAHNRFFTPLVSDPNISEIGMVIFGDIDRQRLSLDGTIIQVKLPEGDHVNHPCLDGVPEYDYDGILILMQTPEWVNNPPI